MDYKKTLNLPKTSFSMKANLTAREPLIQKRWREMDIYSAIRRRRKGAPKFVMHDGPPYANGGVHIGTGMNKILKDFVVKYFTLRGYDAPFVPGWDCHGLPIEHKVITATRELGETASPSEIRRRCRAYAEKFIDLQREQFRALGVFADWDNPYLTFTPSYEEGVLDVFQRMFERGYVVRALKSIHWCMHCVTALADAELEYAEIASPSIHVLFPDAKGLVEAFGVEDDSPAYVLIWTTTPWTLPANVAAAVNPEVEYVLFRFSSPSVGRGITFAASSLLDAVKEATGFEDVEVLGRAKGEALVGLTYRHPFLDRTGRVIAAPFVTVTDGTGVVHIAPGHGAEDYQAGVENDLPIISPVDEKGRFTDEVPLWKGMNVHEADPLIVEHLRSLGLLAASGSLSHSYPHCWRCKNPVIFRATPQWFVSVDHENLRGRMLEAVKKTRWVPAWGEDRIASMITNRPDWCISRQRVWGVPIPALYCNSCGSTVVNSEMLDAVRAFVREHGADGYFDASPADFLPEGFRCPHCGGSDFTKEKDIFDVWFESGSSFRSVVMRHPQLRFPADVYLEGTDQHRGWFQLSLLPALAAYDEPPFETVITHGFIVDEWGQKLSKSRKKKESKYDVTAAHDCVRMFGADVVRLWISSVDYREDVLFSEDVVSRLNSSYFAIRNCFRFMLGNLSGFTPAEALPYSELKPLDRWALARLHELAERASRHYENFEFHRFYQDFRTFCDVTLSSDYFDIIKDRLYCDGADSPSRRAARTVLFELASALVRMVSPVLVHTAEEIWEHLRAMDPSLPESVHLSDWPELPAEWADRDLAARFDELFRVRYAVRRRLEALRAAGELKRTEEAAVTVHASDAALAELLRSFGGELADLFKTAEVTLADSPDGLEPDPDLPAVSVAAERASWAKCARCWNHRPEVGSDPAHPDLCARCVAVVKEAAE